MLVRPAEEERDDRTDAPGDAAFDADIGCRSQVIAETQVAHPVIVDSPGVEAEPADDARREGDVADIDRSGRPEIGCRGLLAIGDAPDRKSTRLYPRHSCESRMRPAARKKNKINHTIQ